MSSTDLVALVCCDLGSIVRGRSLPGSELERYLKAGVGWVPANHALTPLGPLAEPNPFGSTGDLRLLPDIDTRICVEAGSGVGPLELVLCDIVETDGQPWECCPRRFLRDALAQLQDELGLRLTASFEHEFQLLRSSDAPLQSTGAVSSTAVSSTGVSLATDVSLQSTGASRQTAEAGSQLAESPPGLPFSLEAQRRAEPFAGQVMSALARAGVRPERFFSEYAARQFEIPVEPAEGIVGADRAVVFREVVRELARRHGLRASFTPLLDPAEAGNGVHIHLDLLDAAGASALHDASRPAYLSELGERFAAGILLHAGALSALSAPSPISATRLAPHHWSAGAVCLGQRNREALLRLPPLVSLGEAGRSEVPVTFDRSVRQLHLEYRGADASANPYLALGGIVRAGLDGVRAGLPAPPILDRDPAQLDAVEAKRYGVGALPASLQDSLRALAEDATARAWMTPLLYEAYVGVKRAELAMTAEWDIEELCRRYASVY